LADARVPVLVLVDLPAERAAGVDIASVTAAIHSTWTILSRVDRSVIPDRPVMERLYPYALALGRRDEADLYTWERIGHLLGMRRRRPRVSDDGGVASGLWLVTTTMSSAVAVGRSWGPTDGRVERGAHGVPLDQLEQMALVARRTWLARSRRDDASRRGALGL